MSDYRIEAATKEEWAERALRAEAKLEVVTAARDMMRRLLASAEDDLEKAVGQMQRVKDYRYDPNIGIELNRLEEALAELKGETDA
jgi:hypothetical protein